MMKTDEDALLCDLAETYHIFDIKAVPVLTLARLSCGLRENSRIKMKLMGYSIALDTLINVQILDELRWIHWSYTKDGKKNRNVPPRLLDVFLKKTKEADKPTAYDSTEAFEKRRAEILRGER